MTDRELMQKACNHIFVRDENSPLHYCCQQCGEIKKDCTAPPKSEWVGLTDEEVGGLTVFEGLTHIEVPILSDFVRAIEARLKEKNG